MSSETNRKIKNAVAGIIPEQQIFTIYSSPTGFDNTEVVRVVTPAWKNLGKAERISKVHNAVMTKLAPAERNRIFRFSVLTPGEWKELRPQFTEEKSKVLGFRRGRAAAKNRSRPSADAGIQ